MLIYQLTKNKLVPHAPMDLETLNYFLHVQNDYVNKAGIVYDRQGFKICEVETYAFPDTVAKKYIPYTKDIQRYIREVLDFFDGQGIIITDYDLIEEAMKEFGDFSVLREIITGETK